MMSRRWRLVICGVVATASVVVLRAPVSPPPVYAASPNNGLTLVAAEFFVDTSIDLSYVLTSDAPEITEPTPVTTTTTTTTTTTIVPDDTDTSVTPTPSANGATSTTSTPTTLPLPSPLNDDLVVRVALHRPLGATTPQTALGGEAGVIIDVVLRPLAEVSRRDPDTNRVEIDLATPLMRRTSLRARRDDVLEWVNPGLTPVSVSVVRSGVEIASHVTLVDIGLNELDVAPLHVSVLAAIGRSTPVSIVGDSTLSGDESLRIRNELGQLTSLLAESAIPATIAIDPQLAAGISDGTLTEGLADPDFDRLVTSNGGELIALPNRRIDPSAAAEAGLETLFNEERASGAEHLNSIAPSTTPTASVWLLDDTVAQSSLSPDGLTLLTREGLSALITSESTYMGFDGATSNVDSTQLGMYDVDGTILPVVITGPISRVNDDNEAAPTERAVEMLSAITHLRRQSPALTRWFVMSDEWLGVPDAATVRAFERMIERDPTTETNRISDVTLVETSNRSIATPMPAATELIIRQLAIAELHAVVDDTASMLPINDARVGEWSAAIDDLYDSRTTAVHIAEVTAWINDATSAPREVISLPASGTVNLTGRDTPLPLLIENAGSIPLNVLVSIDAPRLVVPEAPIPVTLRPGTTTVRIPVEARSNGTFDVTVEVLSPKGTVVVEAVSIRAKSMTLSGFGRLVGVGLILVLLSWWYSHIRQTRKPKPDEERPAALG